MSLPRIPHKKCLPSFLLVLTQSAPMGESIEVLTLKDFRDASRREVHLSFQPRDDDPLMKTVDTRFSGTLGYEVEYSVTGSFSSLLSMVSTDDEDDTASSTSTMELDLNREFEAELGFETDSKVDTVFESDVEVSGPVLPLHRQPAALLSLAQAPPFPPHRYRSLEEENASRNSECGVLGPIRPGSQSENPSRPDSAPQSSRFIGLKFLLSILKMFSSLWWKLKKGGGLSLASSGLNAMVSASRPTGTSAVPLWFSRRGNFPPTPTLSWLGFLDCCIYAPLSAHISRLGREAFKPTWGGEVGGRWGFGAVFILHLGQDPIFLGEKFIVKWLKHAQYGNSFLRGKHGVMPEVLVHTCRHKDGGYVDSPSS
ncbi:hypothetical protein FA13DRAFT_1863683 [Coprinellus micaceus]|uniref:Uncharacterized protein n=1 Tax=Coprinellus micaceus TaxID=71717 RepID=A0A4Y7T5S3_COPMI|nr:hypothetical protein FA13DRAFT_1863683 [Coprinellus micaceus]